jgi:phosphinothricin acetyltransferase
MSVEIREALMADAPAILAIQNEIIANTTAIYREKPVSLTVIERWMGARIDAGYPVFAACFEDELIGYGSFGSFRPRPGYRFTVEHSVHVDASRRGQGAGSALMGALIARAKADGYHVMVGAVDASNGESLRFHERFGFKAHAPLREIGLKHGQWLDMSFVTLRLDDGPA